MSKIISAIKVNITNGTCYAEGETEVTWHEAKQWCEQIGVTGEPEVRMLEFHDQVEFYRFIGTSGRNCLLFIQKKYIGCIIRENNRECD